MHQTIFRALILGSIVAALAFTAPGLPAFAEDDPASEDGSGPEAAGINWVKGWETGRAQAEKDGKLIFLYFGRKSPT